MSKSSTSIIKRYKTPAIYSHTARLLAFGVALLFMTNISYADTRMVKQPIKHPDIQINQINPSTAIYALTFGGFDIGYIRYQLKEQSNGQFQYLIDSNLNFLVLYDRRQIIADFVIDKRDNKVIPASFSQIRKGTGKDYQETITFDLKTKKAQSTHNKTVKTIDIPLDILDPLTAQMQMRLDFLAGKTVFKYPYLSDKKIESVQFKPLNDETLTIKDDKLVCRKVEVSRKSKKRNTYIWFAKNLAYLPVKVEDSRKGKEAIIAQLVYYHEDNKGQTVTIGQNIPLKTIHDKKPKKKKHLRK